MSQKQRNWEARIIHHALDLNNRLQRATRRLAAVVLEKKQLEKSLEQGKGAYEEMKAQRDAARTRQFELAESVNELGSRLVSARRISQDWEKGYRLLSKQIRDTENRRRRLARKKKAKL